MGYYRAPYLHQAEYAGPPVSPPPLEEAPPVDPQVDGELDKLGVEAE